MAIYHMSLKYVSRGQGHSAVAAAAYRAGERLADERAERMHDYTGISGRVAHKEIMLAEGAPEAWSDRAALWNAAEASERRKDARTMHEIEVALPRELRLGQSVALLRDYLGRTLVSKGMCVDLCVHVDEEGSNPHAHATATTRVIEGGAFGKKNPAWLSYGASVGAGHRARARDEATRWRASWAEAVNEALEAAGHAERVDHRSHKERGLAELPTRHMGKARIEMERRGSRTRRGDANRAIREANEAEARLGRSMAKKGKGHATDWQGVAKALSYLPRRAWKDGDDATFVAIVVVAAWVLLANKEAGRGKAPAPAGPASRGNEREGGQEAPESTEGRPGHLGTVRARQWAGRGCGTSWRGIRIRGGHGRRWDRAGTGA